MTGTLYSIEAEMLDLETEEVKLKVIMTGEQNGKIRYNLVGTVLNGW